MELIHLGTNQAHGLCDWFSFLTITCYYGSSQRNYFLCWPWLFLEKINQLKTTIDVYLAPSLEAIHDLPVYGLLLGQKTKGYKCCPRCGPNITNYHSIRLGNHNFENPLNLKFLRSFGNIILCTCISFVIKIGDTLILNQPCILGWPN
jgi:hypothetical protein